MNIGIVLSKSPAYSETFFNSKIKGLLVSGHDVTLFVQKNESNFSLCKIKKAPQIHKNNLLQILKIILVITAFILKYPKRFSTFVNLEKKEKRNWIQILKNIYNNAHILNSNLDWVHFGFATMALQSEHVAKSINARMAVSFRGFDMDIYPLKHPNCYQIIWENIDKIHSISGYLLNKGYQLGLSKETKYKVITPAVDTALLNRKNVQADGELKFLTIGRLHWIKGLIYTLEALSILKDNGVKFIYNIVGTGPEYDNIVFGIHQFGLDNMVNLIGQIPHNQIFEHLSKTDIYLQYSNSEGFCNAVLEAQAMKCLCIVSDGGALTENVVHGQTGWIVPKRNPKQLARTIQEVINLPDDEKAEVTSYAHQRVLSTFNLEKQQKEFNEFYGE